MNELLHFVQPGDNFGSNNNYKSYQNKGFKPRRTFLKNPKEIREKYEQNQLAELEEQCNSLNLEKGWSIGEQSVSSLKVKEQNTSKSKPKHTRNDYLPRIQFQTHHPRETQRF